MWRLLFDGLWLITVGVQYTVQPDGGCLMGVVLSVDFGTSNTAAVLRRGDGRAEPLLFDGSPLLPSAVFAQPDGSLLTGRDAIHSLAGTGAVRAQPEAAGRRRRGVAGGRGPGHGGVRRSTGPGAAEARRIAGEPIGRVVLTHPAGWGPRRRTVLEDSALEDSAEKAGLGGVTLGAEPVAAARYFSRQHNSDTSTGTEAAPPVVIYDFGGGTFDVSAVSGTRVLATEGLADAGGLDIDAALIAYLQATYRQRDPAAWDRLRNQGTPADRRAWWQFTEDVRTAKEMLSRTAQTFVHIPLAGVEAPISREQVEAIATPLSKAAITDAGLPLPPPGPVFLVGGASRMPLV